MRTAAEHLDLILDAALDGRVAPAIVAAVGRADSALPLYIYSGGTLGKGSKLPCTPDTFFDFASLTKILCTTLVVSEAIALGKLSLSEQPFRQWPGVRVVDLLQHTSGLPAVEDIYDARQDRRHAVNRALAVKLETPPRTRMVYSDVGFIALGDLLEKRLKKTLDVIFGDLALKYYRTNSLRFGVESTQNTAPTGVCTKRRRQLRGEVNDLNAFALGQVAGHAGLFGTIFDAVKAARFLLESYRRPKLETQFILNRFMKAEGMRAIGFDRAERRGTTDGVLSKLALGHLGFTGTSLWIDPITNAYFILLTNRVENSLRASEILQLRRDFHRAAVRLLK